MVMLPNVFQVFILGLLLIIPAVLIYRKAGFNTAWAAMIFLPVFGILLVFLQLAFLPWPNRKDELEHKP